jgi:2-keto-4-pentenoate hydratase/2-oxohepta-3-ene-1,7-dioic acid hydratase in catechol pathway
VKIATFTEGGSTRIGIIADGGIRDLGSVKGLPADMASLLAGGSTAMAAVRTAARSARLLPLDEVRFEAPMQRPRKFLGLGANYYSHNQEMSRHRTTGKHQIWFNKQVTCINGPYDEVHLPRVSNSLDYEGELALIIGSPGRHVKKSRAIDLVAGFTVCNDFSVREWQQRAATHTLGKSFDTHGPIGPWMVTRDELSAAPELTIRTWVNGELRQNGNTRDFIYSLGEMIEELSTVFTLEPGDILSTGTPAGVGFARVPPAFLGIGDRVRVEIEGIGHIENRIIAEP